MSEHPNFLIACRLWEAIAKGDVRALGALMSEKVVWRMYGSSPLAGSHEGLAAIVEFMARVGDLSDDLQAELIDVFVSDQGAVLRYAIHAARGSQTLDTEHLFVIRVANGRIVEGVFAPIDQRRYDRFFSLH